MASKNLSDLAYKELLNRIIACEYAPGSLLSEEKLVEDIKCSRTPIRSALVRLEGEHLVQIISKRGILIKPISLEDIRDVYNLRELLETYAIKNYGSRFSKVRLMEFLQVFKSPTSETDYFYADTLFHREIIAQTQNSFIEQQFVSLQHIMQRMARISGESSEQRIEVSHQEHIQIITALLQDDLKTASDALQYHLNNGRLAIYQAVLSGEVNSISSKGKVLAGE